MATATDQLSPSGAQLFFQKPFGPEVKRCGGVCRDLNDWNRAEGDLAHALTILGSFLQHPPGHESGCALWTWMYTGKDLKKLPQHQCVGEVFSKLSNEAVKCRKCDASHQTDHNI